MEIDSLVELHIYPDSEFDISHIDCVLVSNELKYISITLRLD